MQVRDMAEQVVMGTVKPEVELGDVVRLHGEAYLRNHRVSSGHRKVLRDVSRCRTAALGGHVDACDECGTLRISYNS